MGWGLERDSVPHTPATPSSFPPLEFFCPSCSSLAHLTPQRMPRGCLGLPASGCQLGWVWHSPGPRIKGSHSLSVTDLPDDLDQGPNDLDQGHCCSLGLRWGQRVCRPALSDCGKVDNRTPVISPNPGWFECEDTAQRDARGQGCATIPIIIVKIMAALPFPGSCLWARYTLTASSFIPRLPCGVHTDVALDLL